MGYELRRHLREALGPDIKGLPRAVALEIADGASDTTRENTFATLEDLARWTASKDTSVVRDALKRLAADGWEFRVPIGRGKDGRALYAVPGTRMTFRVPEKRSAPKGRVTTTPKGESPLPLEGEGRVTTPSEGRVTTPSEGVTTPSEGVTTPSEGVVTTPYSSSPHSSVPTAGKRAAAKARAPKQSADKRSTDDRHQVADDLTAAFWERHGKGCAQSFIAVRGVIRTAIGNDVDRDQLARALDQVARDGRAISGGTLATALGSLNRSNGQQQRGGARASIAGHDLFNHGQVTYQV